MQEFVERAAHLTPVPDWATGYRSDSGVIRATTSPNTLKRDLAQHRRDLAPAAHAAEHVCDAGTAAEACVQTSAGIARVRRYIADAETAGLIRAASIDACTALLEAAQSQVTTALSTRYESEAIQGHLRMAVAIADRALRTLESELVLGIAA